MEQKAGGPADKGEEMTQPYHVVPEIVVVSIEPIELRCSICDEDLDCDNSQLLQDVIAAHLEKHQEPGKRSPGFA